MCNRPHSRGTISVASAGAILAAAGKGKRDDNDANDADDDGCGGVNDDDDGGDHDDSQVRAAKG